MYCEVLLVVWISFAPIQILAATNSSEVASGPSDASAGRGRGHGKSKHVTPKLQVTTCTRCSKDSHPQEKCPAKDAECYRCKRKGHYGVMCLSKTVAANSVETSDLTSLNPDDICRAPAGALQISLRSWIQELRSLQSGTKHIYILGNQHSMPPHEYSMAHLSNL